MSEPKKVWIGWPDGETPEVVDNVDPYDPQGAEEFIDIASFYKTEQYGFKEARKRYGTEKERDAALAEVEELKRKLYRKGEAGEKLKAGCVDCVNDKKKLQLEVFGLRESLARIGKSTKKLKALLNLKRRNK